MISLLMCRFVPTRVVTVVQRSPAAAVASPVAGARTVGDVDRRLLCRRVSGQLDAL